MLKIIDNVKYFVYILSKNKQIRCEMNNIENREPVYGNSDMVKLANTFGVCLDDLVIKRYDEIVKISDSITLFDINNEERKELVDFFQNAKKTTKVSVEFIFLCLKFNPQFYNFAQMIIRDGKKKKLNKDNDVKSIITNFFHKKTK